ncbi:MAG: hypothetical protein ACRESR_06090, partial [Gammaproteobacteria bacterium]
TGGQPGMVTCDLGSLDQGASKAVTIAVKADQAGKLDSHFEVSAREPNDSDKSTLDIGTTVIGTADVSASGSSVTITKGKRGEVKFEVSNAGPDPATDVEFKASSGGAVKLAGGTSSQGSCTASGNGGYLCDIGEIKAGAKVEVTMNASGVSTGAATVQGLATSSSDDPNHDNNVATASVTVKSGGGGGGGGGAFGWLALAALLGLALVGTAIRKERKRA